MGQYFTPVVKENDGKMYKYYAHQTGEGLKLTEHTWFMSDMCDGIMARLFKNPCNLVWVGDFAKPSIDINILEMQQFSKDDDYNGPNNTETWEEYVKLKYTVENTTMFKDLDTVEKYGVLKIINHTQKQYVDLEQYIPTSKCKEFTEDALNPMALLTAIGNTLGGGDYWGSCQDMVGIWAGDLIEVDTNIPDGYDELVVRFVQGEDN